MNNPIRLGIVGLGKMGILHSGIINSISGTNVTAICEKETFLTTAAKAFLPKRIAVYKDYQKMMTEEQLDAVAVPELPSATLPTNLLAVITIARLSLRRRIVHKST